MKNIGSVFAGPNMIILVISLTCGVMVILISVPAAESCHRRVEHHHKRPPHKGWGWGWGGWNGHGHGHHGKGKGHGHGHRHHHHKGHGGHHGHGHEGGGYGHGQGHQKGHGGYGQEGGGNGHGHGEGHGHGHEMGHGHHGHGHEGGGHGHKKGHGHHHGGGGYGHENGHGHGNGHHKGYGQGHHQGHGHGHQTGHGHGHGKGHGHNEHQQGYGHMAQVHYGHEKGQGHGHGGGGGDHGHQNHGGGYASTPPTHKGMKYKHAAYEMTVYDDKVKNKYGGHTKNNKDYGTSGPYPNTEYSTPVGNIVYHPSFINSPVAAADVANFIRNSKTPKPPSPPPGANSIYSFLEAPGFLPQLESTNFHLDSSTLTNEASHVNEVAISNSNNEGSNSDDEDLPEPFRNINFMDANKLNTAISAVRKPDNMFDFFIDSNT